MAFNFFKVRDKKSQSEQTNYSESFHEKYRPKKLSNIIGQDHITSVLKKSINGSDMPHLLFYGPPGSGKSSTIKALCNELYGNRTKEYVLHLNASDERGIGIVREKIKHFAQYGSTTRKNGMPFKIIVLDEADNITDDAQTALRRTIEIYSRSTRFCLICNHISNINHPLRSRCAVFRFKPLMGDEIVKVVLKTVEQENMKLENVSIAHEIVRICNGDFRKILTHLEALHKLYGDNLITTSHVVYVSRHIPRDVFLDLMDSALKQPSVLNIDSLISKVNVILSRGYSGVQILDQLFDYILQNTDINDSDKPKMISKISSCELALEHGSDDYIQLINLLANIK